MSIAQELEALRRVGRVVAREAAAGDDDRGARRRRREGARAPRRTLGAARLLRLPRLPLPVRQRRGHGIPGDRVLRAGDLVKVDVTAHAEHTIAVTRGQPLVLTAA